jgi:hypothetical protein
MPAQLQAVMPSDTFSWPGPDVHLTGQSQRTGIENNWYALTGRVVAVKTETDGDLHIDRRDATGDKPRIIVVEYQSNRSGVRSAKRFSVGHAQPSLCTSDPPEH